MLIMNSSDIHFDGVFCNIASTVALQQQREPYVLHLFIHLIRDKVNKQALLFPQAYLSRLI